MNKLKEIVQENHKNSTQISNFSNPLNTQFQSSTFFESSNSSIILTTKVVNNLKKGLTLTSFVDLTMRKSSDSFSTLHTESNSKKTPSKINSSNYPKNNNSGIEKKLSLSNLNTKDWIFANKPNNNNFQSPRIVKAIHTQMVTNQENSQSPNSNFKHYPNSCFLQTNQFQVKVNPTFNPYNARIRPEILYDTWGKKNRKIVSKNCLLSNNCV